MSYTDKLLLSVNKKVREKLRNLPSADTDYFEFTERLYKEAYERGKAEAQREYVNGYAKEYTIEQMNQARYIGFIEGKESAQRWIPVTERLPIQSELVLVTFEYDGLIFVRTDRAIFNKDRSFHGWELHTDVTAWMPLPEPWKGGDAE